MHVEVFLPVMGETMDEGTVSVWLAHTGDRVRKGQVIVEIETNKAVFELEAPVTGVLRVLVRSEQTVPVLTALAIVETDEIEELPALAPFEWEPPTSSAASGPVSEILESVEADVAALLASVSASPEIPEPVMEAVTDREPVVAATVGGSEQKAIPAPSEPIAAPPEAGSESANRKMASEAEPASDQEPAAAVDLVVQHEAVTSAPAVRLGESGPVGMGALAAEEPRTEPEGVPAEEVVPEPEKVAAEVAVSGPEASTTGEDVLEPEVIAANGAVNEAEVIVAEEAVPEPEAIDVQEAPEPEPIAAEEVVAEPEAVVPEEMRPESEAAAGEEKGAEPAAFTAEEVCPEPEAEAAEVVGAEPEPEAEAGALSPVGDAGAAPTEERRARSFVSPRARHLVRELGVAASEVQGTGPGGRVEERDVLRWAEEQPPAPVVPASTAAGTSASAAVRRVVAARMSHSARTTAPVTLVTEADATTLVALRGRLNSEVGSAGTAEISYDALLVRFVAMALSEHPQMNARFTETGAQIVPQVNVGVAVDAPRGLLVPVLRDAGVKDVWQIAGELAELTARALSGASGPDELAGGTFTITNLGAFGVDAFTPIINWPECAILGVGRIAAKPAVHQGRVVVRQMVTLSLTFDHRAVDGAPAARFLQRLVQLVQSPEVVLKG